MLECMYIVSLAKRLVLVPEEEGMSLMYNEK